MTQSRPVALDHRVYITSFPKSGTHLAEQMIGAIADKATSKGWLGTFMFNGWSTQWTPGSTRWSEYVPLFPAGGYLKGHTGWRPDIAQALHDNGVSTMFVFRDLRDVVVSQAHHAISTERKLSHPGMPLFLQMKSFDDVMIGVIEGVGRFAGLFERWNLYAPWLLEEWVLPVRFEAMRYHAVKTASSMLRYVLGFTANHLGIDRLPITEGYLNSTAISMVERAGRRSRAITFRKGTSGEWRRYFTPRVVKSFDKAGGADWLIRLGYEKDTRWLTQTQLH